MDVARRGALRLATIPQNAMDARRVDELRDPLLGLPKVEDCAGKVRGYLRGVTSPRLYFRQGMIDGYRRAFHFSGWTAPTRMRTTTSTSSKEVKQVLEDLLEVVGAGVMRGERVALGEIGRMFIRVRPA
jgi:hypothetical protein